MKLKTPRRIGLGSAFAVATLVVVVLSASLALADKPTQLEINKVLIAGTSDYDEQEFSVQVQGLGELVYDQIHTFGSNKKITLDLLPGEYTITEVDIPSDIQSSHSSGQQVTVTEAEKATVTVTNTYIETEREGIEDWAGNGGENNCQYGGYYHWILTAGGGGSTGFEVLSAELTVHYKGVAETTVTQGERRSGTGKGAMHFDVHGAPGEVLSASATYRYIGTPGNLVLTISDATCDLAETGSLQITKEIVDAPDATWTPADFSISVTGPSPAKTVVHSGAFPAGGVITINDLDPGTYTITESDPGANWIVTGSGDVSVVVRQTTGVTITNTWTEDEDEILGSLVVTKSMVNPPNGTPVTQFSVQVTGPGGYDVTRSFLGNGTATFDDLALGVYTVAEIAAGGDYTVGYSLDDQITLTPTDPDGAITITNTWSTTSRSLSPDTTEPTDTTESSDTTASTDLPATTEPTDVEVETTEPTDSPTTSVSSGPVTSTPTPSGIQTGGGGTAGLGVGIWALIAMASVLGIGLSASAVRLRQKAK
ncbi:MAG: DUF5979 domain-containing protein [bacterium]